MKKVAVGIVVYNHGRLLEKCLDSWQFDDDTTEPVILDRGSTDEETRELLNWIKEKGVQVIENSESNPAAAFNEIVKNTSAPYLLMIHPVHTICNRYISLCIETLDKQTSVGVCYSDVLQYDQEEKHQRRLPDIEAASLLATNFIGGCAIYRKTIWEQAGGYDSEIRHPGYESWDMWLSALANNWQFHHIEETLSGIDTGYTPPDKYGTEGEAHTETFQYLTDKYSSLYAKYNGELLQCLARQAIITGNQNGHTKTEKHWEKTVYDKEVHIQNIEKQNEELVKQVNHSMDSVLKLQRRINALESSPIFKFLRELNIILTRFRSNSSMSKSKSIFSKLAVAFSRKSRQVMRTFLAKIFKNIYIAVEDSKVTIVRAGEVNFEFGGDPYMNWLKKNRAGEETLLNQRIESREYENAPKLSIIIPVYNPPIRYFKTAIESIIGQSYENWELILSDDCSTDRNVKKVIQAYCKKEPRIKPVYRTVNGHISAASNSGLKQAEGDFVVLMDQDDLLPMDALYEVARKIVDNPDADLIYTDEDKVDEEGYHSFSHFKPDWSPESLLSRNYLGHLTAFRTSLLRQIGGWREGYEGSQDYDLVLRCSEQTDKIYHIPKILYHWRIHDQSVASSEEAKPYAFMAAQKALTEALQRRGIPGNVDFLDGFRGYTIRLAIKNANDKVSIIIPTKDKADILSICLNSVFEKTTYPNYEVVIIDNNSEEKSTIKLFEKWTLNEPNRFKVIETSEPFNFSHLMNLGRKNAEGQYLMLLNNDTEIISQDWLESLVEQAQRKQIGVVGAKLLYPNDTVQHAGVVVGLGGAAGHVLVGEHRDGPGYFNYVNLLNNYSALTAAGSMVRTEVFDEVNGFYESYAVEFNDVDFCLRVMEAGYRNVYIPHSQIYHFESISRGHPHLTKKSFERHKAEIKQLRSTWKHYIDHDPHYNPNLSLGSPHFDIKSD